MLYTVRAQRQTQSELLYAVTILYSLFCIVHTGETGRLPTNLRVHAGRCKRPAQLTWSGVQGPNYEVRGVQSALCVCVKDTMLMATGQLLVGAMEEQ